MHQIELAAISIDNQLFHLSGLFTYLDAYMVSWLGHSCPDNRGSTISIGNHMLLSAICMSKQAE